MILFEFVPTCDVIFLQFLQAWDLAELLKTESVKSGGELLNWDGRPLCRIDVNVVLEEILEHPASSAT